MPEADDDQLAALRRLRAAFGPIEVSRGLQQPPDQPGNDGSHQTNDP